MSNEIQKGALYKIKEGVSYDKTEEYLSPIVRMLDYASDSNIEEYMDRWFVLFSYVFEDSLESTSMINPLKIIKAEEFLNYFELYKDYKEVNEIIFKQIAEEEID
jgi:hypothetical protein